MSANNTSLFHFHTMDDHQLLTFTTRREGESKLGERVKSTITAETKFVILGICEDIGPRANMGNTGATNAFEAFLLKFLNMQSNRYLAGDNIAVIGHVSTSSNSMEIEDLRRDVNELDQFITDTLSIFDFSDKQLIVIGGGHNNAYPIMKSMRLAGHSLDILNIDPHADCRPLEGRHSGNPFSTALLEKLISSYTVFGLHQQYNSEGILNFLDEHNCEYRFFEDYLDQENLMSDLQNFIARTKGEAFGVEIDLDAIEFMPSSAISPSGFTINEIRSAIRFLAKERPKYLHLPEGAPLSEKEKITVGKSLAYFVTDFIKNTSF